MSTGGYVGRDTLYSRYAFGPVCFIDRARVVGTHAERETKATAGKIIGLGIDRRALRNCPRRASSLRLAAAAVQKTARIPGNVGTYVMTLYYTPYTITQRCGETL